MGADHCGEGWGAASKGRRSSGNAEQNQFWSSSQKLYQVIVIMQVREEWSCQLLSEASGGNSELGFQEDRKYWSLFKPVFRSHTLKSKGKISSKFQF